MKLGNTEFTILGANPDDLAVVLNEEFPTREALIGSTIEAYGEEFVMLERNLGMQWIAFFMKLMTIDTSGISCTLGGNSLVSGQMPSVSWTFKLEES